MKRFLCSALSILFIQLLMAQEWKTKYLPEELEIESIAKADSLLWVYSYNKGGILMKMDLHGNLVQEYETRNFNTRAHTLKLDKNQTPYLISFNKIQKWKNETLTNIELPSNFPSINAGSISFNDNNELNLIIDDTLYILTLEGWKETSLIPMLTNACNELRELYPCNAKKIKPNQEGIMVGNRYYGLTLANSFFSSRLWSINTETLEHSISDKIYEGDFLSYNQDTSLFYSSDIGLIFLTEDGPVTDSGLSLEVSSLSILNDSLYLSQVIRNDTTWISKDDFSVDDYYDYYSCVINNGTVSNKESWNLEISLPRKKNSHNSYFKYTIFKMAQDTFLIESHNTYNGIKFYTSNETLGNLTGYPNINSCFMDQIYATTNSANLSNSIKLWEDGNGEIWFYNRNKARLIHSDDDCSSKTIELKRNDPYINGFHVTTANKRGILYQLYGTSSYELAANQLTETQATLYTNEDDSWIIIDSTNYPMLINDEKGLWLSKDDDLWFNYQKLDFSSSGEYLGSLGSYLGRYSKGEWEHFENREYHPTQIMENERGELWMLEGNAMHLYQNNVWTVQYALLDTTISINKGVFMSNGSFCATGHSINQNYILSYHNNLWEIEPLPENLLINHLEADKVKGVWLLSSQGAAYYNDVLKEWTFFSQESGLPNETPVDLNIESSGKVWLSFNNYVSSLIPNHVISAIDKKEYSSESNFYPNPVKDKIYVSNKDNQQVTIYDLYGNLIQQFTSPSELDISHLEKGTYLINFTSLDSNKSFRFVKE